MCSINTPNTACQFETVFSKHATALPVDEQGLCIFHSKDLTWKRTEKCGSFFLEYIHITESNELETQVSLTGVSVTADTGANIDCSNRTFTKALKFKDVVFHDILDFRNSVSLVPFDFFRLTFEQQVYFQKCRFEKAVLINNCKFIRELNFNEATFNSTTKDDNVSFTQTEFEVQANFPNVAFNGPADLNIQLAHFKGHVYFTGSVFERYAIFDATVFQGTADFRGTSFLAGARFNVRDNIPVQFKGAVDFEGSQFNALVDFDGTRLGRVSFKKLAIAANLKFTDSTFGECDFSEIKLEENRVVEFTGNKKNKLFNGAVSFLVNPVDIRGILNFKSTKLGWVHPDHLKILTELEESGHAFFDAECEFDNRIESFFFDVPGEPIEYETIRLIIKNLEPWIYTFIKSNNLIVDFDSKNSIGNKIALRVHWKKEEDKLLFSNLAKYYFECLSVAGTGHEKQTINAALNLAEVKILTGNSEVVKRIITGELEVIINGVLQSLRIKSALLLSGDETDGDSYLPRLSGLTPGMNGKLEETINHIIKEILEISALSNTVSALAKNNVLPFKMPRLGNRIG